MLAIGIVARRIDAFGARLRLVWAGLVIGVAFLATPAKFLAPSLSVTVALDIGRHTFRVYNWVELGLAFGLLMAGIWSRSRRTWYLALAAPVAIVICESLWLLPALDARVGAILGGAHNLPPSNLHSLYIGAEAIKAMWLLGFGFAGAGNARPRSAR